MDAEQSTRVDERKKRFGADPERVKRVGLAAIGLLAFIVYVLKILLVIDVLTTD